MRALIFACLATFVVASCTQNPYTGEQRASRTAVGAGAGAALGAAIGALTNTSSGEQAAKNALIGAGIGALAGGAVGGYMDVQERRLRQELQATGVSVTRNGNQINLNMPGNVVFDVDSSTLSASFVPTLNSVAKVLDEYERTIVFVEGHTDSTGSASYNQQLSERRANSVARYLIGQNIRPERFVVRGYGENRPIASNETTQGRAQNRRVEIRLEPLQSS
jgi:outer membrane protein OmpA-like peptidoglycan-associated protein